MKGIKIFLFFFCFIFFYNNILFSKEIKNLVIINNSVITNFDLEKEIKLKKIIEKIEINNIVVTKILGQLINEKIQFLEVEKNNIVIGEEIIDQRLNQILKSNLTLGENQEIKSYIRYKIKLNLRWNKLINFKYKRMLEVNMNEINEIMLTQKLKEENKDEIIQREKNKKLNLFSRLFLNEIKKDYLIKKIK